MQQVMLGHGLQQIKKFISVQWINMVPLENKNAGVLHGDKELQRGLGTVGDRARKRRKLYSKV